MGVLARVDAYQRCHRWAGLPLAVVYKFYDDQGTYLAALLAYYAFVSLFPLLLILVAVLGALLSGSQAMQERFLDSALREFPVIGDQIGRSVHSLQGSGVALGLGVAGTLYGALGVAQAAQHALNKIWAVPRHARSDPFRSRLKGLLFLSVLAVGLCVATLLSTVVSTATVFGTSLATGARVAAVVAAVALNAFLLLVSHQVLTHRRLPLRQVYGAALGGACAWQVLQWGGSYYVNHVLRGATATYGMFGIVLGLLAWLYLGALVFLLTAEVSAVRTMRLWPRSLLTPFTDRVRLSPGDRRAYQTYAATEVFKGFEKVQVQFGRPPRPASEDRPPDCDAS
ncbi:YihY/virulence factor BrkB family protein [Streptomyces sp. NPDC001348]